MAKRKSNSGKIKVIMLGGLNEVGKNLAVIEYEKDMIIVDCGLGFPDDDMLGIDIVIPDFSYLEHNRDRFRGIVLTHAHEDHIGGLPYLLKNLDVPVYGTRLTLGLVEGKLKEAGLYGKRRLNVVKAGDVVKLGCMSV
ncbi:MAG: ribonuclease J, partial [Firmicutes bacterium]|nr:ribonuclease J [Bacillota bacterium]